VSTDIAEPQTSVRWLYSTENWTIAEWIKQKELYLLQCVICRCAFVRKCKPKERFRMLTTLCNPRQKNTINDFVTPTQKRSEEIISTVPRNDDMFSGWHIARQVNAWLFAKTCGTLKSVAGSTAPKKTDV